jgi:hypothetical protein
MGGSLPRGAHLLEPRPRRASYPRGRTHTRSGPDIASGARGSLEELGATRDQTRPSGCVSAGQGGGADLSVAGSLTARQGFRGQTRQGGMRAGPLWRAVNFTLRREGRQMDSNLNTWADPLRAQVAVEELERKLGIQASSAATDGHELLDLTYAAVGEPPD